MPGCERLLSTLSDCGGCDVACTVANGTPSCATGSCAIEACDPGYDDCDGRADDGCEQALNTLAHCTACDAACTVPSR